MSTRTFRDKQNNCFDFKTGESLNLIQTFIKDSLSCVMSMNNAGATEGFNGRLFGSMKEPVGGPP